MDLKDMSLAPKKTQGARLLKGALVWTGRRCDSGFAPKDILVKNGRIVEVAETSKISASMSDGAEVMDLSGFRVTPGLIDAHTHIGVCPEDYPRDMDDTNERTNPVTPELRALDALYSKDTAFNDALSAGVTCVQALPGSANVLGGQGVILKTRPDVVERMAIVPCSSMKAALGENPLNIYGKLLKKTPLTRMAIAALIRGAFVKAQNYAAKLDAAISVPDKAPDRDLGLEALVRVLKRELPVRFHAHRVDDIQTAIRIGEEFNLKYSIEHCTEGNFIASWLAEKHVYAAVGPTMSRRAKIELCNKSWTTPVTLWKAGVHFCIITDHPVTSLAEFPICAALASKAGLPYDEALRGITLYSAEHLGIENRVGTIEPDRDADLAIWDGDPLDARTNVTATIINGQTAYAK